jgi:hypothetical protein
VLGGGATAAWRRFVKDRAASRRMRVETMKKLARRSIDDARPKASYRGGGASQFEDPLDDEERVLDFGSNLRLGPILRPLRLIDDALVPVPAVGEILAQGACSTITSCWPR